METCPHYLVFASEDVPEGATQYKCAPPLRPAANQEKLWQYMLDGRIDSVATDHSPAPPDMKHLDTGDFSKAWGGISGGGILPAVSLESGVSICEVACQDNLTLIRTKEPAACSLGCPGCIKSPHSQPGRVAHMTLVESCVGSLQVSEETLYGAETFPAHGWLAGLQYGLPGTWEGLKSRGAGPELLSKLWSAFPARLAGLQHRKGSLAAGLDADITVRPALCSVDPHLHNTTSSISCSRGTLVKRHGLGTLKPAVDDPI